MSDEIAIFKTKNLDQLLKALKRSPPVARIGVLGSHATRTPAEGENPKQMLNNAEIGAIHEYGSPVEGLPQRSFLRVPITTHLGKAMEASEALSPAVLAEVVKSGTILPWTEKVAIMATDIVGEAFATGGFGEWKQSNMDRKKVHMTLIESQQLRNSISYEVKE